jgi:hypothetical protein
LPARPEYVVDTSEFTEIKARLAALENRKKIITPGQEKKPTLRRTQTASSNPNDPNSQQPGDDRPTLSKRDDD